MRLHRMLLSAAAIPVLALSLAACSDSEPAASPESGQVAAVTYLDSAGLHDIDESINDKKEIPATARATALKSAAVLRSTDWPEDKEDAARALSDTMAALAEELDKDNPDLAKAGELAKKAHDESHDFTAEVWDHLYEHADLPVGEHGH